MISTFTPRIAPIDGRKIETGVICFLHLENPRGRSPPVFS
jgi:hypothetical protein